MARHIYDRYGPGDPDSFLHYFQKPKEQNLLYLALKGTVGGVARKKRFLDDSAFWAFMHDFMLASHVQANRMAKLPVFMQHMQTLGDLVMYLKDYKSLPTNPI